MKRFLFLTLVLTSNVLVLAQTHLDRFESTDVQHYVFEIHLNDSTNRIEGKTTVTVKFLKPAQNLTLDLVELNSENNGMIVQAVKNNEQDLPFIHANDKLGIHLEKPTRSGEIFEFQIEYSGIPQDGLVISENKYGERTFFGDNWPDRARNWLPTVDHPSDKATLEFLVYAPEHYEVISNGYLVEKKRTDGKTEFTHWKEDIPLSTKLMVIGVADFAVGNYEMYKNIPVSSWVFSQNKEKGLENYKNGAKALKYFSELIGPYSYEKLAHVQSKTRYGGMENASCIFYSENSATSDRSQERLFAHEVAHQWFGNSVTEENWHHVWLSEGFATYLTHVYNQHFLGEEAFRDGLKNDRDRVIRYAKRNPVPVIDTTVTEYIRLLNANSYQKASWFLHMLRNELGDEIFFKGLRKYYADFQNSTALTKDFQKVMESVSGKELDLFFEQWLMQTGHPVLKLEWTTKDKNTTVSVQQDETYHLFYFPLEIEIQYEDGSSEFKTFQVVNSDNEQRFMISSDKKVQNISFDPNIKLLFELDY